MSKKLLALVMIGCLLAPQPMTAAGDDGAALAKASKKAKKGKKAAQPAEEEADDASASPELAAARKRLQEAQAAADQLEKTKKSRSRVKPKWFKDADKAFAEAAKYNLPVWVVYSDPPTCAICQKFEKEIINSGPVKNAKGAYIGFISNTPLPEYNCKAKPYGYLYGPDKKPMIPLPYMSTKPAKDYASRLKEYSAKVLEPQEKKITRELEYAKSLVEALKNGQPAPPEPKDEEEEDEQNGMNNGQGYGPNGPMPPRRPQRPQYEDEEEDDGNSPVQPRRRPMYNDEEEDDDSSPLSGKKKRPTTERVMLPRKPTQEELDAEDGNSPLPGPSRPSRRPLQGDDYDDAGDSDDHPLG